MEKKTITTFYNRIKNPVEQIALAVLLFLYPMTRINQGISVVDTTYSLSNFEYFGVMDGTWMTATYLSNVLGHFFMILPGGKTLLGINFYTSLCVSFLAIAIYYSLRKKYNAWIVFFGEIIAISMCWCPTTILYNYLTYLVMGIALLCLYRGIVNSKNKMQLQSESANNDVKEKTNLRRQSDSEETSEKLSRIKGLINIDFILAGILLGLNVAVRMPNIVQAGFILSLWFAAFLKKEKIAKIVQDTFMCIVGYVIGFGITFLAMGIQFEFGAWGNMVYTMFAMTEKAADYKPTSMVTGMFADYIGAMKWVTLLFLCVLTGFVLFRIMRGKFVWAKRILLVGLELVVLRFFWGRGMFDFRYYNYGSVYEWVVLFLMLAIGATVWCMVSKKTTIEEKVLASMAFLQIFLTPLGSNNGLYPIMNNLFLVAPFTLWCVYKWWMMSGTLSAKARIQEASVQESNKQETIASDKNNKIKTDIHFSWQSVMVLLIGMLLIQGIGFHQNFALQDGVWGEARDSKVQSIAEQNQVALNKENVQSHHDLFNKTKGMYTNSENAKNLSELMSFIETENLSTLPSEVARLQRTADTNPGTSRFYKSAILYGEVPGLGYFLDIPSALSTFWPDLDSYRMVEFERDMDQVDVQVKTDRPLVIVSTQVAAYMSGDADAMEWFGVPKEDFDQDMKLQRITKFVQENQYEEVFSNAAYAVYK